MQAMLLTFVLASGVSGGVNGWTPGPALPQVRAFRWDMWPVIGPTCYQRAIYQGYYSRPPYDYRNRFDYPWDDPAAACSRCRGVAPKAPQASGVEEIPEGTVISDRAAGAQPAPAKRQPRR
ncbi:MAG: hypothetical protein ACYC35_29280 [Pirellulales bacterium]